MEMTHASDRTTGLTSPDHVRRADDLAAAGQLVGAIRELTEANRLERDVDREHRLVQLRHQAFQRPEPGAGAAEWPPTLTDPFPGATAPPEISPADLDAATLGGAIQHHGCLIVRGFQPRDRAEELRDEVVAALAERDAIADGRLDAAAARRYRPFRSGDGRDEIERVWVREVGGILMADAPGIMFELLETFERSGALAAITEYLGERPALSFNKCVLRRLRQSAPTWHQDGAFMGEGLRTVDVWLALSECGEGAEAPGLDIVPKRIDDILETFTHGSTFPNSIGPGLIDIVAADAPVLTPRFAPGDAILFDDRFVHRSGVGDGYTKERYAIETWFFAGSRFPDSYLPILL